MKTESVRKGTSAHRARQCLRPPSCRPGRDISILKQTAAGFDCRGARTSQGPNRGELLSPPEISSPGSPKAAPDRSQPQLAGGGGLKSPSASAVTPGAEKAGGGGAKRFRLGRAGRDGSSSTTPCSYFRLGRCHGGGAGTSRDESLRRAVSHAALAVDRKSVV